MSETLRAVATEITPRADAWASIEKDLLRRRHVRIASAVGSVCVLAILAVAVGVVLRTPPVSFVQEPDAESVTYRNRDGWSWIYPRSWDAQRVRKVGPHEEDDRDSVLVGSSPLGEDTLIGPRADMQAKQALPLDGVIVEMFREKTDPEAPILHGPATRFPISIDDHESHRHAAGGDEWRIPIKASFGYRLLWVWIGDRASSEERQVVRHVVASIKPDTPDEFAQRGAEAEQAAVRDPRVIEHIGGRPFDVMEGADLMIPSIYGAEIRTGDCGVWECWLVAMEIEGTARVTQIEVTEPDLRVVSIVDELSEAESDEAHRIAESDPNVIAALPDGHVHGSPPLIRPRDPACGDHRCALVVFNSPGWRQQEGPYEEVRVLVDLDTGGVVKVEKYRCGENDCIEQV